MSTHKESSQQHKEIAAEKIKTVHIAIVTVSDTRTAETDVNGHYLLEQITAAGHEVVAQHIVKDEADQVEAILDTLVQSEARLVLFNGGTGIALVTEPMMC